MKQISNLLRGIRNIIRGCLMMIALAVSSIAMYQGGEFTQDIAFCIWCICIVQFIDYLEYLDNRGGKS
jgi:hypothetical protein